jgi:hypothetical protein
MSEVLRRCLMALELFAVSNILFILMSGNFALTKCVKNIKDLVFPPKSNLNPFGSLVENGNCSLDQK